MTCYAIGHLREVTMGPDINDYLENIDETLVPFAGKFQIHGGQKHNLEGRFVGDLIVISFPDLQRAQAWYQSAAYQAILPKRKNNSRGDVFLIEGVASDHKATDILPDHSTAS